MGARLSRPSDERAAGVTPRGTSLLALMLVVLLAGCGPSFRWESAPPESQGLEPEPLAAWADALEAADTESLLLIRNDRIVLERHVQGLDRQSPHFTASLAKGVVGGLGIALLLADERLELDEPVAVHLTEWASDPRKSRITLRQLASHTSGVEEAGEPGVPKDELTGWKSDFWQRRESIARALDSAPVIFEPGGGFQYSNTGFAVISAVLARAGSDSLPDLLRDRLFRPLGVPKREWSIGYREPFRATGDEVWATWGGAAISTDALARLGRLLLRRGDWEGERLLPAAAVEQLRLAAPRPERELAEGWPAGALGWWTNAYASWPELPRDAFLAAGSGHQILLVVPSWDLVLVRFGEALGADSSGGDFWPALHEKLLQPLARALPAPPVPHSEVIGGAWFSPLSTAQCRALDSDNWPLTWGPGHAITTAYGDGYGFEPRIDEKLSNGFARLTGGPTDYRAENFRAPSGELRGQGPEGGKASGLLAVDGSLIMAVRNLDNTRLAWSDDGGSQWEWGFRFDTSFGSGTFLQFGRDYAGARDDYVYLFSQDGPSAYESDDRLVLARAQKDRLRERDGWEFFAGLGPDGELRFSPDIELRRSVLTYPGRVKRSEVVFDADLGRYLLALGFDHDAGWGLFEAPEPWGPWRTVYHTLHWDVGRTHSYRLPTAWIRDGGRTLWLVYSGKDDPEHTRDGFCVRQLRLPPLEAEAARS